MCNSFASSTFPSNTIIKFSAFLLSLPASQFIRTHSHTNNKWISKIRTNNVQRTNTDKIFSLIVFLSDPLSKLLVFNSKRQFASISK